ncbi:hypothetical protein I302_106747 [Kwoniella bestiolae CBS 10118]|uniref:4a-hydroxytetrahydrobiopterin dehydratase n=1 Tax=Kwoniella bestiolae CBS 10118 TaxID=1296100 RepID=A0A1B9G0I8_9TREE|nr:hypothetical protein I302_05987 [Kwoniella bestiolae CBS 10118]OCF24527.1 hypothetical protein I302_05987 [Kwoniella bestiolae CBS 10118]
MIQIHSTQLCRSCTRVAARSGSSGLIRATPVLPPVQTRHSINAFHSSASIRSEQPSDPAPPKRPSPYRLIQPHTFLSQFAPLHISGWRLDSLSQQERLVNPLSSVDEALDVEGEGGDLQNRRLVRAFVMGEGREGWRDVMRFTQRAGEVIEQEDHHPTVLITPLSDYIPSTTSLQTSAKENNSYIIEISTHTHTPLPPYPTPTKNQTHKMRPGVTGKDIRLAERLEHAWEGVMGGKEKVEMKRE